MSIPYNTYNGTKCLLLPDSMKNCKAMAKSDNTDKQKYTFESQNHTFFYLSKYWKEYVFLTLIHIINNLI